MEVIEGGDLAAQHKAHAGNFNEAEVAVYTAEILSGLWFLHNSGIIYRDLKLDNILLDKGSYLPLRLYICLRAGARIYYVSMHASVSVSASVFVSVLVSVALSAASGKGTFNSDDAITTFKDGHIKLSDFGLAKDQIGHGGKTRTMCGTARYLAPEIVEHNSYGTEVDLWALGVCMFELLLGSNPFTLESVRGADGGGDDGSMAEAAKATLYERILGADVDFPSRLSTGATVIISGLLHKSPEQRLGCHARRGEQDLKECAFLRHINWDHARDQKLHAPIIPQARMEDSNSSKDDINPSAELKKINPEQFGGFNDATEDGSGINNSLFADFDWAQTVASK